MFPILLFAACNPDLASTPAADDVAELVAPDAASPRPRPTEAAAAGPAELHVKFAGEIGGFVEITAYRAGALGELWTGMPLLTTEVTDKELVLQLPAAAPKRDRASERAPVYYAVAQRAADENGEPGIYTGFADADLVYVPAGAGGTPGWGLGMPEDGLELLEPVNGGLRVDARLVGETTLELDGTAHMMLEPGTHLAVATGPAEGQVSVFDAPIEPDWSVSLTHAGRLMDAGLQDGALMQLQAYLDADGDNAWGDEPAVGRACAGTQEVYVSWFPEPHDLPAALELRELGVPARWGASVELRDGLHPLPDDLRVDLFLMESCNGGS